MMNYSFVVPVYNCKAYLPACVESIRSVNAPSCEIVLVDDGSTDGSGEVCDALAAKYPEVRVIHQANGGASAARNRGIREARGQKLLFFDADDTIDSEALGSVLADPRCDEAELVIYGIRFDYYSNGDCYRSDSLCFDWDGILDRRTWTEHFLTMFEQNALSSMCTKIFSRSILIRHQLELNTDMFLYEDFEFVLRYMRHCGKIWNVPRAIYHYRQSEDEGNAKRRLTRIPCLHEFMRPIEAALDDLPGVAEEQKAQVLVQLFQVLAREKISVSDLREIRGICADYGRWYQDRGLSLGKCKFHDRLMNREALLLWLLDKKTALRHALAVRVKSTLSRLRK